ncbi:hypothetical protein [Draconibacterium orientale]|uniref:hypothetical protein n=1 Tax=Draconibacterium orientale TaxID=1168034 RepID=UPI0029C0E4B9|nr:hypothetical protein [Draconibacterium orientale]
MDKRSKQYKTSEKHREEINAWLESEEREFDEGYNLFVRFSHNRALAMMLARTRRHSKLVYELQKIADRAFVKDAPVMPLKKVTQTAKRHQENVDAGKIVESAGKKIADGSAVIVGDKLNEMELGADDVISDKLQEFEEAADEILLEKVKIVRDGRMVNLGDLPEDLQKLWFKNRDEHKLMRSVHEKMKLAKGDVERAEFRAQLVDFDDRIAKRWGTIDKWFDDEDPAPDDDQEETDGEDKTGTGGDGPKPESVQMQDLKEVNAARSYLSRYVKKVEALDGEKREKLIAKLKDRVAVLEKHNAEIKEDTRVELVKLGLLEDNGNK